MTKRGRKPGTGRATTNSRAGRKPAAVVPSKTRAGVTPRTSRTSSADRNNGGQRQNDHGQPNSRGTAKNGAARSKPGRTATPPQTDAYQHPTAESLLRPDVGTQAQFRKKKPPKTYRYDSSLSPALDWDGQNAFRELGEWLLACVEAGIKGARDQGIEAARDRGSKARDVGTKGHRVQGGGWPKQFKNARGEVVAEVRSVEDAIEQLRKLGRPLLNWAGKAERLSFDVPTLPLFVHERLSTQAILQTLRGHKRDKQLTMFDLFADPQLPIHDQVLRAYEHKGGWVNRLILGDSLAVMNSLLGYESLGGQVQMIYMDPPYGVKFGSNFQPFVRKRDVKHNDDADMTREPEMVKAYRDTWELGLHSYLTYLRDRLLLCRELLHPSGSMFVQIGDENLHHVREVMDEVFGPDNLAAVITVKKTTSASSEILPGVSDYLLWYARDIERMKYRQVYLPKTAGEAGAGQYNWVEEPAGVRRPMRRDESVDDLPLGYRVFCHDNMTSQRPPGDFPVEFDGRTYRPVRGYWKTGTEGMERLKAAKRLLGMGRTLRYVRYLSDFQVYPVTNLWDDTVRSGFDDPKIYAVQTITKVVERCVLMTTDPGDLILDPTCGSGTTAYVAEQWGRRWITIDTSRVPLALARQRLLTATFPYYELKDESRGPASGFVYQRKQNQKGEEVGGIVPHVTLKSIANNEPPDEEVLVDRPEEDRKITRVTGPFCFEATIPTPVDWEGEEEGTEARRDAGTQGMAPSPQPSPLEGEGERFVDRMLEVLRRSPVLHIGGGKTVTLKNVRQPAKTLSLSAEALVDATAAGQKPTLEDAVRESMEKDGAGLLPLSGKAVAIVFGPENGAISEKLVYEAAREGHAKAYTHLYVIGFAIQPNARKLVEDSEAAVGVPATYVQATPDLMMGDLLKNMRSSQIFSVCGLPEVEVVPADAEEVKKHDPEAAAKATGGTKSGKSGGKATVSGWFQVNLLGLDVFDPTTMETDHRSGADVPCWLLDTDYNGLCFHVCQAFFPRTAAWDDLKRALRGEYDDTVWDHLAGTTSAPFQPGEHGHVAVKVIDDRGNELMVVTLLGR